MRYRKLRIAWSVALGIACALSLALWVWSYYQTETLIRIGANLTRTSIKSQSGMIAFWQLDDSRQAVSSQSWWRESDEPANAFPTFWYAHTNQAFYIHCPYWAVTIVLCMLAIIPWLHRFSLRALLIATTAVACALGVVSYIYRT